MNSIPTRNLALELVRVTEAAALAAGRFMGRGDKIAADKAAVDAMRLVMNTIQMDGVIVIGEGEKDQAPMLFNGERLGTGQPPLVDIAVDPIDGTRPLTTGNQNSIAVVAIAPRGTMFDPGPCVYMNKIAVGPEVKDVIDINATVKQNLENIAKAKGEEVADLTVVILDRPRHEQLIKEVRLAGARIRLIPDGDITASMSAAVRGTGDHLYVGIGGSTEGVITAAALECLGGEVQAQMWPRTAEERERLSEVGLGDPDKVMHTRDLAPRPRYVLATGVTDGNLLRGVRYFADGARTHSIVLDLKGNTVRFIDSVHIFSRTLIKEIRL
jgi:fructose-1,6-bisphosphatase II